jgi:hypothetical protein
MPLPKVHSKRVEKMLENTLETGGKDAERPHSKQVEKMLEDYTRNGWRSITVHFVILKRTRILTARRIQLDRTSSPLVSSVVSHLLHSFRV